MLARLRSDALDHAGDRRRVRAAPRADGPALVLRLQRTIGNRATTRLLRQPADVVQDVEQERARFDAARERHEQRLREIEARETPHALRTAGITTDSLVNKDTPKWIQAALAESRLLRPYLRGKFPGSAITTGTFEIHTREADFNRAHARERGITQPLTDRELAARFGQVGGFFDRRARAIHVRSRTKFGHAVHEAMHKVAHPAFHGFFDETLNEGVTQYFTDRLLEEQGLSKVTDHTYQRELDCAERLVRATSPDVVARAYFLFDNTLRDTLMQRFRLNAHDFRMELRAGTFCRRL